MGFGGVHVGLGLEDINELICCSLLTVPEHLQIMGVVRLLTVSHCAHEGGQEEEGEIDQRCLHFGV